MMWFRSWPDRIPEGRAHVVDSLPRIVMSDRDYLTADLPTDEPGFCLLEWDVVLDRAGRDRFVSHAAARPRSVLVAPYRIRRGDGTDVWVHRARGRWVTDGAPSCDWFGFGCIYLPRHLVTGFLATNPRRFSDSLFSRWHHDHHGPVPIDWDVHPQHLHHD